jgi:hypothetical protein
MLKEVNLLKGFKIGGEEICFHLKIFTHILQKERSSRNLSGENFLHVQPHKTSSHWTRAMWVSTKGNFYAECFEVITTELKPVPCQKKSPRGRRI